jgi:inorganic triphosphatase YgiF
VSASGAIEREVKLDVDEAYVVPDLAEGGGIRSAARPPLALDATYFDAPDLRLLELGITVRRRTGEGTRWTVKFPTTELAAAGGLSRREVDITSDDLDPPSTVTDLVRSVIGGAVLEPVARLESRRERLELVDDDGVAIGELDDDRVTASAPDGAAAVFREVEVEFGADADAALVELVVERLRAAGARPSDGRPKVERALGLLGRR